MPERRRLRPEHTPAVLAFEQANRASFAASVPDRGDDFFANHPARHAALPAEQATGACHFHVLVDSGEILGRFNLMDAADGTAELGFRLAEKARGRGLATTTVHQLFDLCRTRYALTTLTARAALTHTGSRAVPTRTGFAETGEEVTLNGEQGVGYVRESGAAWTA
ncbi:MULTISPECIES: GNAT family N-acetyltransferase [unclassified Streptomyces]|uniref:GNAT family N-acetyltransferase n=1 Tax=unclassified Streptomyces TaxID=2593676 RepID=UPI002ED3318D|nr:GNAT family N-acetyltransferase [Streptomyces sp. NBC_00891]WSY05602.1 GNAT family N-acetyltransferase [Streptomyces sp. NBC_00890]WSZ07226.1 GNAT family N-acetyltransferase [Streptomyces sp. NBC_00869]WSZ25275.1 GNAT family N-acetyltransferase [Streptomyces sp. NBC_00870]